MTDDLTPARKSILDTGHDLRGIILRSIPLVGESVARLVEWMTPSPFERGMPLWQAEVERSIRDLESQGAVVLEDLQRDPAFMDVVLQASRAAYMTSKAGKREALRNTILNSALPNSPDDSTRQIFINILDELAEWHLHILKFLADYSQQPRIDPNSTTREGVLRQFPELAERREFLDMILNDLGRLALIKNPGTYGIGNINSVQNTYITKTGRDFLSFISAPTPGKE